MANGRFLVVAQGHLHGSWCYAGVGLRGGRLSCSFACPSKQRRHGPHSGWFPPGAASAPCPCPSPLSSWLLECFPPLCCVLLGLGKNVAPGLLRCLGYVGVFPVGERYALCLLSWKRMPGTVVPVQGQMSR